MRLSHNFDRLRVDTSNNPLKRWLVFRFFGFCKACVFETRLKRENRLSSFKLFQTFTKLCSLGTCKWMFSEFPKSSILIGGRDGSLLTLHPVNSVFYDCIIFFFSEPNFVFPRTTDKVPSFILIERFCNECSIDKRIVTTSFF